jgi:hypothetical protein
VFECDSLESNQQLLLPEQETACSQGQKNAPPASHIEAGRLFILLLAGESKGGGEMKCCIFHTDEATKINSPGKFVLN